jgi:branched-subunit amino acid aminotransferase/4-amino-4-deoxychorismate lyase
VSTAQPALPVWLDRGLVAQEDAVVSALDAGLRSGLGVFETLRAHGTTMLAAHHHLERLELGAQRLGIVCERSAVQRALDATLAAPRAVHEVVVRITLTAGAIDASSQWPPAPSGQPTLIVTLHPAPPLPLPPAHAVTTGARRWPADIKSTSYVASVLATREARAAGADIAVMCDGDDLLETAEGNLFAIVDGTLVTPADDGRLLAGVTRRLVLEAAAELTVPVRADGLARQDASRAEALAVSSSVGGLRTILTLDGRPTTAPKDQPDGAEHPVIVALRERLTSAWARADGDRTGRPQAS